MSGCSVIVLTPGGVNPAPTKARKTGTKDGHERRARKTGTEDGHGRQARKTGTEDKHERRARKTGTEDGHGGAVPLREGGRWLRSRLGLFVGEGAGGVDGDAAVDEQGLTRYVAGGFG